jgi:protein-S-isoprenylcysteine O-methyltransferase Ste14
MGGVAFVLSLTYVVYFYMVELGDVPAAPDAFGRALAVDLLLFTAFALHHSILARPWAKAAMTRIVPPALERTSYVWVASALLVLTCLLWQFLGGTVYRHGGGLQVVHLGSQFVGVWIIAGATRLLDPLELAGIRQVLQWSAQTTAQPGAAGITDDAADPLTSQGPYRFVRHPIYLGWLLVTFGVAHMSVDRGVFATISAAYLLIAMPFEERSLLKSYGEQYRSYMEQVKWRIVPYLW